MATENKFLGGLLRSLCERWKWFINYVQLLGTWAIMLVVARDQTENDIFVTRPQQHIILYVRHQIAHRGLSLYSF